MQDYSNKINSVHNETLGSVKTSHGLKDSKVKKKCYRWTLV